MKSWRIWLSLGSGIALLALALCAWIWLRLGTPVPPLPDLTNTDPEIAEAMRKAQAELLKLPRSGSKWGHYGSVLRVHHFIPESNICYIEAARLDPRDPRWPYLHGLALVLDEPESGVRLIQRAVEIGNDNPLAPRLRLAEALIDLGRLDEAETQLQRAAKLDPGNPRVNLGLARSAFERAQWQDVIALSDACLEYPDSRKKAYQLRAKAWYRLGEPRNARQELEKDANTPDDKGWPDPFVREVALLQEGMQARMARADEFFMTGQQEDAIQMMEQLVKDRPESAEAWLFFGRRLVEARQFLIAERVLELHALRLDPQKVDGWFNLGIAKFQLEKWKEAADCFRKAIRYKTDHALAHYNLGQCHRKMNDLTPAAEEFRMALQCRPDLPQAEQALRELNTPPSKSP